MNAFYTKALGKLVAAGARPDKINKIHIISRKNDSWSVVIHGKMRSSRSSLAKSEALIYGKRLAVAV